MKLSSVIASRPVVVFILLAVVVLLLPSAVISFWYKMTKRIEANVTLDKQNLLFGMQSEIEITSKLLHPINSSATNLARVLTSSLHRTNQTSFTDIKKRVAPALFQAFSIIPHISQISYIGLDGLFFSYYIDSSQILAVYSISSFPSNSSTLKAGDNNYTWYTQHVDLDTGKLYGEAIKSLPLSTVNTSWFQEGLNSKNGYASLGNGWKNAHQDPLFLNTASVYGIGVVSLGFPLKALTDFYTGIELYGGSLYLSTMDGEVLVEGLPNTSLVIGNSSVISFNLSKPNSNQIHQVGNISCFPRNGIPLTGHVLKFGDKKYQVYCSQLEIVGVQSVYALIFPHLGLVSLVHKNRKVSLILLGLMIASVVISVFSFVVLMVRAAKREMHLCATIIKQMEATQQAERKSMNKSLAFASASHDIRASLAGITGLIELCCEEVAPGSELETNLRQMDGCTKDLVGLLNSILDTSKIEAGKMQLQEEEFNLAEMLEDVVDLYHPVGMKKDVDVVLDPYDGSVLKFSNVKGDRGKLKQVLCNLLSNAVKFTSEGHISLRAWVKKPSFENSILAPNRNGFLKYLPCLFYKNKNACEDLEAVNAARQNPNTMEFVFEVDDTGKGIPKEQEKSVFENYVQVKETALGQGGTGLGLGIVQSLVRLMGGEIGIVDKEVGERGTCFKFNVFLQTCETPSADSIKADIEAKGDSASDGLMPQHHLGLTIRTTNPSLSIRTPSPRLNILSSSPKLEGSQVVLLMGNEGRRKVSQKYMENLGINVSVVERWENLPSALKKMKSKLEKSNMSSRSDISSSSSKDVPLSSMEGADHKVPCYRRRGVPGFILMVIDASAGPFPELYRVVTEFRHGLHGTFCKVVWLNKPTTSYASHFKGNEDEKFDTKDDVQFLKPFHGSRLFQVMKLLPEFGGTLPQGFASDQLNRETMIQRESSRKGNKAHMRAKSHTPSDERRRQEIEIQENDSSASRSEKLKKRPSSAIEAHVRTGSRSSPTQGQPYRQKTEIEEEHLVLASSEQPLSEKRILVADDNSVLRTLAKSTVMKLGATVELCVNGKEAVRLVIDGLRDLRKVGSPYTLPYDYVLMDCEMPTMDGYEATREIRKEEKHYGVHIPIIALTAHTSGEETNKMIKAGMDVHLSKPLSKDHLIEAIRYIHNK